MDDMVSSQNFRSESLMTPTEKSNTKALLESLTPAQFEFRKKQFQEDHAEWFAEQNKIIEEFGLWCEGHVPWMSEEIDNSAAGWAAENQVPNDRA